MQTPLTTEAQHDPANDPIVPPKTLIGLDNNYRFIRLLQRGVRAALVIHGIFLFLFLWMGVAPLFIFNIGSVMLYGVCIYLMKHEKYELTILLAWLEIVGHAVIATALLGFESGFQYYIIVLVALIFTNAHRSNLQKIILICLLCFIYTALDTTLGQVFRIGDISVGIISIIHYFNIVAMFGLLGGLVYLYAETAARGEARLIKINTNLQKALSEVKTLRGILPLCSFCKKIRDDQGYWNQVDVYLRQHYSEIDFSHGVCPECQAKHYPDFKKP